LLIAMDQLVQLEDPDLAGIQASQTVPDSLE
jgi:hypothetical protein